MEKGGSGGRGAKRGNKREQNSRKESGKTRSGGNNGDEREGGVDLKGKTSRREGKGIKKRGGRS